MTRRRLGNLAPAGFLVLLCLSSCGGTDELHGARDVRGQPIRVAERLLTEAGLDFSECISRTNPDAGRRGVVVYQGYDEGTQTVLLAAAPSKDDSAPEDCVYALTGNLH